MALVINIVKDSINDAGTELNLRDDTGLYDVSDNPGGYGSPNPNRNQVSIILLGYNKRQDEGDVALTFQNYSPTVDSTFVVNLYKEGWYQIKSYGLRLYSVNTSFDISEAVYDTTTSTIRKILTKSGSGPYTYTYEVITSDILNTDAVTTAYASVLNTLVLEALCKCHASANKNFFNNASPVTNTTEINTDTNFQTYLKIDAYLKSIKYSFGFASYTQAQLKVEQAEKICDCIDDNCDC